MPLGNMRPLIPLNVDPPKHSKYRKMLDPLFAPKRMDEQEADITRRVNDFIDAFVDRGECNFTEEFAELFPSSVFLGLMGLPEGRAAHVPATSATASCTPRRSIPNAMFDVDTRARGAWTRNRPRDLRLLRRRARRARAATPTDDILSHFVTAEIDGERLTREEILDICFLFLIAGLDTVSDSLTCFYAFLAQHPEHRRQLVDDPDAHPGRGRGAAALGVAGAERCAAHRHAGHRAAERRARSPRAPR